MLGWKLIQVNTLRPGQNGRRFADDTFKRIFLNENFRISIKISLKFVPKGPINNNPALVQIMAWRRSGAKPLSEPMMVSLLTHICVTGPQWVNKRAFRWRNIFIQCFVMVIEKLGQRAHPIEKHGDIANFSVVISITLSLLISNLWGYGPYNQKNRGHSWSYNLLIQCRRKTLDTSDISDC